MKAKLQEECALIPLYLNHGYEVGGDAAILRPRGTSMKTKSNVLNPNNMKQHFTLTRMAIDKKTDDTKFGKGVEKLESSLHCWWE